MGHVCFAAGSIVWEGPYQDSEEMRAETGVSEDLMEDRWSMEVDRIFLRELWVVGRGCGDLF